NDSASDDNSSQVALEIAVTEPSTSPVNDGGNAGDGSDSGSGAGVANSGGGGGGRIDIALLVMLTFVLSIVTRMRLRRDGASVTAIRTTGLLRRPVDPVAPAPR